MPSDDDKVMITVTSEGQGSGELMVSWTKTDGMELGDHEVGGDSRGGYVVQYGERQTWSTTSDHTLLSQVAMGSSVTLTGPEQRHHLLRAGLPHEPAVQPGNG